jgi:hypothetical protein
MLVAFGKPVIMLNPRLIRASLRAKICPDKTILSGPASIFKITVPQLSFLVMGSNSVVLFIFGYNRIITVLM